MGSAGDSLTRANHEIISFNTLVLLFSLYCIISFVIRVYLIFQTSIQTERKIGLHLFLINFPNTNN
jgi:ABC-type phosphate transport system permease subunit